MEGWINESISDHFICNQKRARGKASSMEVLIGYPAEPVENSTLEDYYGGVSKDCALVVVNLYLIAPGNESG